MRLQLSAEPQELRERGHDLVKALADHVACHAPDLADALHKAAPVPRRDIPHKALRQLQKNLLEGYAQTMHEATAEIIRLYQAQQDA